MGPLLAGRSALYYVRWREQVNISRSNRRAVVPLATVFSLVSLGYLYGITYLAKNAAIAILRLSLSNPTETRPLPEKT
jgi:hypothetical protein